VQRTRGRLLAGLVWLLTAGIAVQAVLAGQFISGLTDLRPVHGGIANGLELLSWALILVTLADGRTRRAHRGRWAAALLLGIGVSVQAALGYAPGAVPTAIHVPFGVALFAWSVTLSAALARPRRSPAPAGPPHR
jgi:CHASE2 domain-containing sensor protein